MATIGALLIRADANASIGVGHLMRCLALAQAWQAHGGRVIVAAASIPESLRRRLDEEGMAVHPIHAVPGSDDDRLQTVETAREAVWTVVDGYGFSASFVSGLRQAGLPVLLIDDEGRLDYYDADIVLNQNLHAGPALYQRRVSHTRLLLGSRYTMLRQEFRRYRQPRCPVGDRGLRVLVTLGGADLANATPAVLQALREAQLPQVTVTVLVGPAMKNRQAIDAVAAACPFPVDVRIHADRVVEHMISADVAIAAAGSTAWELAYLGVPSLLLVTAANQAPVAEALHTAGAAVNLGDVATRPFATLVGRLRALADDPVARAAMAGRAQALIDGFGVQRVRAAMVAAPVTVRPVTPADCQMVWEWSNDPEVRATAFSTQPILWDDHVRWFDRVCRADDGVFFIGEDAAGQPVGQVRFVMVGDSAVITVNVAPDRRGAGMGTALIAAGSGELFAVSDAKQIQAFVKPANERSWRAFERAGYHHVGRTTYAGEEVLELRQQRGA